MRPSRRKFVQGAAAAAAASSVRGQQTGSVRGFDHVALPMQNTDAMLAFYRGLGFPITESANACSVYIGDQMINFHRPAWAERDAFSLRPPGPTPPELSFLGGRTEFLKTWLDKAGAKVIEGPVDPGRGPKESF